MIKIDFPTEICTYWYTIIMYIFTAVICRILVYFS